MRKTPRQRRRRILNGVVVTLLLCGLGAATVADGGRRWLVVCDFACAAVAAAITVPVIMRRGQWG